MGVFLDTSVVFLLHESSFFSPQENGAITMEQRARSCPSGKSRGLCITYLKRETPFSSKEESHENQISMVWNCSCFNELILMGGRNSRRLILDFGLMTSHFAVVAC